jgi:hypothetical protein
MAAHNISKDQPGSPGTKTMEVERKLVPRNDGSKKPIHTVRQVSGGVKPPVQAESPIK